MNTFFFRAHWIVADANGSHLASNVFSLESETVDAARAELRNSLAPATVVGLDHIGTALAPSATNNVNRGSW